jgi:signal transduction histidine kinase
MALELKALMRTRTHLATLAERQRLARDLHDTVKQKAFALSLQLATVRRALADNTSLERVVLAERLSQQIQQELAQILDELRSSDAELPLAVRLRARAREWAATSGVALDCELAEPPALRPEYEDALLRITDEALANILRHSGADRARIELRLEADRLSLVIEDNGCGMDGSPASGMGLPNMRARAQTLPDGQFEIGRSDLGGARIRIGLRTHDMGSA